MSTRTLCLNLLVLISGAFPGQAFRLVLVDLRRYAVALIAVAVLALLVVPISDVVALPIDPRWYLIALGVGLLAPLAEYLFGALVMVVRRRRVGRIGLHGRARMEVLASIGAAIAEEVLFRGIGLRMLLETFALALPIAIALTSLVYGLNHLYFGWLTVAQKTMTGVGLGLLFAWSGQSVLIPVLAHVVQNVVVLTVLPRLAAKR